MVELNHENEKELCRFLTKEIADHIINGDSKGAHNRHVGN